MARTETPSIEARVEAYLNLVEPIAVHELQQDLTHIGLELDKTFSGNHLTTNHGVKVRYGAFRPEVVKNTFEFVHYLNFERGSYYPGYNLGTLVVARTFDSKDHERALKRMKRGHAEFSEYIPEPPTVAFTAGKGPLFGTFDPGYSRLKVDRSTVQTVEPESPAAVVLSHIADGISRGIDQLRAQKLTRD